MKTIGITYIALNVADLVTTLVGVTVLGGTEQNPIMISVLNYSLIVTVLVKIAIPTLIVLAVVAISRRLRPRCLGYILSGSLVAVCAFYLFVIVNNVRAILEMLG
jgi:hypothetical protein